MRLRFLRLDVICHTELFRQTLVQSLDNCHSLPQLRLQIPQVLLLPSLIVIPRELKRYYLFHRRRSCCVRARPRRVIRSTRRA